MLARCPTVLACVYVYEQGRGEEGRRSLKLWRNEWKDEGGGGERGEEKMRKKRKDEEKARDQ